MQSFRINNVNACNIRLQNYLQNNNIKPKLNRNSYHRTQPDSHYIRYTAASVLRSTTLSTPEGHWLTCAW